LWNELVSSGQIPFVFDDTVVFLYRGEAERIEWLGSFSNWTIYRNDWQGERIGDSDIWTLTQKLPPDGRFEYRIVLNRNEWILDPANPHTVVLPYDLDPNSILTMPDFHVDEVLTPRTDIEHGSLSPNIPFDSKAMRYPINYQVYLPANYENLSDLPTIYVTDGNAHAAPEYVGMVTVLDNMIADGTITPVIAVFIDPIDVEQPGVNRRDSQYNMNPRFGAFVTTELIPIIDSNYKTNPHASARLILGASLGGLNAGFFGLEYSDWFGLVGMQSPEESPTILRHLSEAERTPVKIFITAGKPEYGDYDIQPLRDVLDAKGYTYDFIIVNEGHTVGNYSNQLNDVLLYFFGTEGSDS
jgi:enterochelin esterase-like enzyme